MTEEKKTRRRRSAEERIADLERKRLEVLEKQRAMLAKIEEEKARLTKSPVLRKAQAEHQKRFERASQAIAGDLDHRHFIAIIAEAVERGVDADALAEKGEALLAKHGKGKRGRRPRPTA
jgi:hypothetical protein